jgi:serine/threonine protein kinase
MYTVQVTDFGLAKVDPNAAPGATQRNPTATVVAVRWAAPEVLCEQPLWSEKSDVWAFGVTVWEVFSNGAEPYSDMTDEQVIRHVKKGGCVVCPLALHPRPQSCAHICLRDALSQYVEHVF